MIRLAPIALLLAALPAHAKPRAGRSAGPHPRAWSARAKGIGPILGVRRCVRCEPWRRAVASHYAPADGHNSGPLACRSHVRLGHDQPIVAHRTLPCGTVVELRRGGLTTRAVVADRGPFGLACRGSATTRRDPRRPWRLPRGWTWRVLVRGPLPPGCYRRASFDLAPAVSKALRLLGAGVGWIEWMTAK